MTRASIGSSGWRSQRVAARMVLAVMLAGCAGGENGLPGVGEDASQGTLDASTPATDAASHSDAASHTDAAQPRDAARPDSATRDVGIDAGPCLAQRTPCGGGSGPCCGDLTCGSTTIGNVCCGGAGVACSTPDGADCCGDLLCVGGLCQPAGGPAPRFSAPYACGERWTYSHHSSEVRLALDFVSADGGATDGAPVLASAAGVASRRFEAGGAGNYVVVEHGDGWKTYYFHFSSYTVADGAWVERGDELGRVGTTGASSGPHLHYEQLRGSAGQTIHIEGRSLAPYPGNYFSANLVSENACGTGGRAFDTWGSVRPVYTTPSVSATVVTTLAGPTNVFIDCQVRGESVTAEGYTNEWWSHLRDQGGYLSNIYVNHSDAHLPGVPDC